MINPEFFARLFHGKCFDEEEKLRLIIENYRQEDLRMRSLLHRYQEKFFEKRDDPAFFGFSLPAEAIEAWKDGNMDDIVKDPVRAKVLVEELLKEKEWHLTTIRYLKEDLEKTKAALRRESARGRSS